MGTLIYECSRPDSFAQSKLSTALSWPIIIVIIPQNDGRGCLQPLHPACHIHIYSRFIRTKGVSF